MTSGGRQDDGTGHQDRVRALSDRRPWVSARDRHRRPVPLKETSMAELTVAIVVVALTGVLLLVARGVERL